MGNLGGSEWFKLAATELVTVNGLWTRFPMAPPSSQWRQRAPIQFYIDVNFAKCQFGVLAATAGLATSHYVDDVLAVDRKQPFCRVDLFACLSSLLWLGFSDAKSPLPSQVNRSLGTTSDVSQTPCGPPTLSISQDRGAQSQAWSKTFWNPVSASCSGRQIVEMLGVQLHSDVGSVWKGKSSSFVMSPHEHRRLG